MKGFKCVFVSDGFKATGCPFFVKSISECPPDAKYQRWRMQKGRNISEAPVSLLVKQTSEDSEGQRSLVCCTSWGHKESDTTEWVNENTCLFGAGYV